MNTMKKTLLALLVILSAHAVSQNFAPVGSTWHYTMKYPFEPGESFFLIESVETVMLQGKECSKLVKNYAPECFLQPKTEYVYEEDGVVYFWSDIIDDFQILFDFNAQSGDMWKIYINDFPPGNFDSVRVHVGNTGFTEINGEQLRYLNLIYNPYYSNTFFWFDSVVERVGSIDSYLFNHRSSHVFVCDFPYPAGLRCYEDEVLGLYSTGIADSCNEVLTHVKIPEAIPLVHIFPNPAKDYLIIENSGDHELQYQLLDINGRVVIQGLINAGKRKLDLSAIRKGVYFLAVNDQKAYNSVRKIVVY
jgi:hypothetical protein